MARGRKSRRKDPILKRRPSTVAGRNPIDLGSPELRMQRLRVHGMADIGTDHPLDSLAAKGLLCAREEGEERGDWMARNVIARDMAARLASLHRALFGPAHARAIDPNARGGSSHAEETPRDLRMEAEYLAMQKALKDKGRRILDAVMNRAVYLRKMPPAESSHFRAELDALRIGLDALVSMDGARVQRAA